LKQQLTKFYEGDVFCCGGTLTRNSTSLRLKVKKNNKQWIDCGPITNVDLEKLLVECKPAAFGNLDTQQIEYGPSVRVAMEYVDSFMIGDAYEYCPFRNLEENVQKALQITNECKLVPYKVRVTIACYNVIQINVYIAGGLFNPRVDTPTDAKKIGTLVISIPCAHEGGQLVVQHQDETQGNIETNCF
jgi:hypothetical protein